ncbi:unnamed protein product [Colias eurytheme]|nr:unnamed protein product [Colias eurytheme]
MEILYLFLVFITILFDKTESGHSKSKSLLILSDLSNEQDREFFKKTYPWIAENIGDYIDVALYFNNCDEDTDIKYCVLQQLDTRSQADYLQCEAEDSSTDCADGFELNKHKFKKCMKKVGKIEREAERAFAHYHPTRTPFIVLPSGKVCDLYPKTLLECICNALFKKRMPRGCKNPSPEPFTTTPKPTTTTTTTPKTTTTEIPTTTEKPTTTETPTTTEKSTSTEKPTTTEKPTSTEKPTTTEKSTTTETPTTTEKLTTTEKSTTSETPTTTEKPSTTDKSTTGEEPTTTTLNPITTEKPTTADKPKTTSKQTTTEKATTTLEPSTTKKPTKPSKSSTTKAPSTQKQPKKVKPKRKKGKTTAKPIADN